jgi:hypothetical protein
MIGLPGVELEIHVAWITVSRPQRARQLNEPVERAGVVAGCGGDVLQPVAHGVGAKPEAGALTP